MKVSPAKTQSALTFAKHQVIKIKDLDIVKLANIRQSQQKTDQVRVYAPADNHCCPELPKVALSCQQF